MKHKIIYRIDLHKERHGNHVFLLIPLPQNSSFQKIQSGIIITPGSGKIIREPRYGNLFVLWKLSDGFCEENFFGWECTIDVKTNKKYFSTDIRWREAKEIHESVKKDLEYGNAILGLYSAEEAEGKKCVDCGGFASLFVKRCGEKGIPARIVSGFWTSQATHRMHAWAEFQLSGGLWVPVDTSIEKLREEGRSKKVGGFGFVGDDRVILSVGSQIPIQVGGRSYQIDIFQNPILIFDNEIKYLAADFIAKNMERPIFTFFGPNYEREDVNLSLRILWKKKTWHNDEPVRELEKKASDFFKVPFACAFSSGRDALYEILRALHLKNGDEVLLQAYTCVVVPNAILAAGGTPKYVDIEKETFTMDPCDFEKKISPQTKVVIFQHTFGMSGKLKSLMDVARKHNLFIIEDCAHTLGGTFEGKLLGTFGDAAFLSFGRDKVISSVFGGMVITSQKTLFEELKKIQTSLPNPKNFWIFRALLHPIFISLIRKYYGVFGKILFQILRKTHFILLAIEQRERYGKMASFVPQKMPGVLAKLALSQWARLDRFNAHRKKIVSLYDLAFGKNENREEILFIYPILQRNAKERYQKSAQKNMYLGNWYQTVIAPDGVDFSSILYEKGSCPVAEEAALQSLNLPVHIGISEEDARRIYLEFFSSRAIMDS